MVSERTTPGQRIRAARIEANLTIRENATLTELTPEAISIIENTNQLPSLNTLRKLATLLDTSVAHLGCFEDLPEGTFGERLKKARYFYGYTLDEADHFIGVDAKSIKIWKMKKMSHQKKSQQIKVLYKNNCRIASTCV